MRRIDEQSHQDSTQRARDGNRHDPRQQQQPDSLEVDGLERAIAQSHADGSARDAHGGRHRQRVLREDEHRDGGSHFHRTTATRRVVGDLVAHDYISLVHITIQTMVSTYPS